MKVGIYCRVSGVSQRENSSLQNQRILGTEFCKKEKYDYEVYEDVESGGKLNRKQFDILLNKVRTKEIRGIWVYDNDRLGRDYDVSGEIRRIVTDNNLRLFIGFEEVYLDDSKDRFNYNIRSVMSDYERMRINERFAYGKKRSYSNGRGLGLVPFGYTKDENKKVIINEEERKIVEYIYKTYLRKDVDFMNEVQNRMEKKYGKILDNGKRLNGSLVGRVLGNECYLGKIYRNDFEGNRYEFNIGRIIDDVTHNRVIEKKERMKGKRGGNIKYKYTLNGKVRCKCCGSGMWIKRGGKVSKEGNIYSFYYCNNEFRKKRYEKKFNEYVIENNKFRGNRKVDLEEYERMYGKFSDCNSKNNNTISVVKLENLVWNSLYDFLHNTEFIKKEYKRNFNQSKTEKNKKQKTLKYYEYQLEKFQRSKMEIMDRWLEGKTTDEEKKDWDMMNEERVSTIRRKKVTVLEELNNLIVSDKVDSYIELIRNDLKNEFDTNNKEDRERVINKYVSSVDVKVLEITNDVKEYDITVKLSKGSDKDKDNNYSFKWSNLSNYSYKPKTELAQTKILIYKNHFVINLQYSLLVYNKGKSKSIKNKRELIDVF